MAPLTEASVVYRAPNTAFRELEGKMFIVGASSTKLIMLNETGTAVWRYLDQPTPLGKLADQLTEEFEINRDAALNDCITFASTLMDRQLLFVQGP
jgi:hypothetical protein